MPLLTITAGSAAGLLGQNERFGVTPQVAMAQRIAQAIGYFLPFVDSPAMAHGRAQEPHAIKALENLIRAQAKNNKVQFGYQRPGPTGVVKRGDSDGCIFSCKPDLWVNIGDRIAACEIKSPYSKQDEPATLRDRPWDMAQVFVHFYICAAAPPPDWPDKNGAQSLLYFVYPAQYAELQNLKYEIINERASCPYAADLKSFYENDLPRLQEIYQAMKALVADRDAAVAFIKQHIPPEQAAAEKVAPRADPPPSVPSKPAAGARPPAGAAPPAPSAAGGEHIKIRAMRVENFKKIKIIDAAFDEPNGVVIVTGINGAGKTTLLQAILIALGAKEPIDEPIRRGEKKATITIDLSNGSQITCVYTPASKSARLTLRDKNKTPLGSPRETLNAVLQLRTIDPVRFIQKTPRERRADLLLLAGFDEAEFDRNHSAAVAERQVAHRAWDTARKALTQFPPLPGGQPTAEVDIAALTKERGELASKQMTAAQIEDHITEAAKLLQEDLGEREQGDHLVEFLEHHSFHNNISNELAELDGRLKKATEQQAVAQQHQQRVTAEQTLAHATAAHETAKDAVAKLEQARDAQLAAAKLPIPDLAISETDLTYRGIAFSEASDGEKLKIALAIAMALNPTLRVIIVREASLLDQAALDYINAQAKEQDYQIWLARVRETKNNADGSIHIVEGEIQQDIKK